jgi:hypothetical protein
MWRRVRDSNPRYVAVYTLSRRAPSATRTTLQIQFLLTLVQTLSSYRSHAARSLLGLSMPLCTWMCGMSEMQWSDISEHFPVLTILSATRQLLRYVGPLHCSSDCIHANVGQLSEFYSHQPYFSL